MSIGDRGPRWAKNVILVPVPKSDRKPLICVHIHVLNSLSVFHFRLSSCLICFMAPEQKLNSHGE